MKCRDCNTELDENALYCTNCGVKQEQSLELDFMEVEDGKLTYSQNPNIKTTYNKEATGNPSEYIYKESKPISTSKDSKAIAGLVLGIISMGVPCLSPILATIGLVLSISSTEKTTKRIVAIVLNSISILIAIFILITALAAA